MKKTTRNKPDPLESMRPLFALCFASAIIMIWLVSLLAGG